VSFKSPTTKRAKRAPLSSIYVYYLESDKLASIWDWIGGVAVMAGLAVIFLLKMTYAWLADSPCHFTDAEMSRWNVDTRLARATGR
jgi:hypothetical protein